MEDRVVTGADDHVDVACGPAMCTGITLARKANPLPMAGACLNPNLQGLSALHRAFAPASGAGSPVFPGSMAAGAGHIELHAPAGLSDLAGALALRTYSRILDVTVATAGGTNIAARGVQPHDPAADRRPERHIDLVLEIGTRLGSFLSYAGAAPAASKHTGENIATTAAACFFAPSRPFEQV